MKETNAQSAQSPPPLLCRGARKYSRPTIRLRPEALVMPKIVGTAVVAFILVACSAGSGPAATPLPTGVQHGKVQTSDGDRTYRLFVPSGLRGSAPLLLVLQGCGPIHNGDDMAELTGLDTPAAADKFLAVYPDALGCWNADGRHSTPDDVGFMKALLDKIGRTYAVDRNRVYATGISGGGFFTHLLGCRMADRLAAIASVAGALVVSDCKPSRPIPVLELHGTADQFVPFAGIPDQGIPSVTKNMEQWAALDGCGNPTQSAAGVVATTTWAGCGRGAKVELMVVQGGQHVWYGSSCQPCVALAVPGEPKATSVVLSFLGLEQ